MRVRLTELVLDSGRSVVIFHGHPLGIAGRRVSVGVDHRYAMDLEWAIMNDEPPIVNVEPWQVVDVSPRV